MPENFKVYKSDVRKHRHSIILLQKAELIPTELTRLYCLLLPYEISTLDFVLRHNCLKKCAGKPCENLHFFVPYEGFPWMDLRLLRLLGWVKQYKKFQLKLKTLFLYRGMMETVRSQLIAGESKRS